MRTVRLYRMCEIDDEIIAMIKREIEILSRLDHPNITKVHAVYFEETRIYLLIDTVRGHSLYEKVFKSLQISEQDAAQIAFRLLSLARYMHQNGLAHRNLRPETIFFETDASLYDLKILDLLSMNEVSKASGLPIIIHDQELDNLTKLFNCSPCFTRSPELLDLKDKNFGAKADLWTIGVILYNMVTGIPPFFEPSETELRSKIGKGALSF